MSYYTQLSAAQLATLAAAVNADAAFNGVSHDGGGATIIMTAFNQIDASNTVLWWSATPVANILNAITFANYTPNDAIPTDTQLNAAIWLNRAQAAQVKQLNLQIMLTGQSIFNALPVNSRTGLRDAVIQVPTGASGAMVSPGGASGATVLTACLRPALATRAEKLFSSGASTTGTVTADVPTFQGQISYYDALAAMGWIG